MNILVSRCLLGEPCRYDGQGVPVPALERLREEGHTLIPVCPEILGGLPTPRSPAEVQPDGRVVSKDGQDVTAAYLEGGKLALEIAKEHNCTLAVLKARSPPAGASKFTTGASPGC